MNKLLLLLGAMGIAGTVSAQAIGSKQKLSESSNLPKSSYKTILTNAPKNEAIGSTVILNSKSAPPDSSILPLSPNGNLLSVDGYEVEFKVPSNPAISSVCFTPSPKIIGGSKSPTCGYAVPCDNPANRDVSTFATTKYFQLVWHVMLDGGPSTNISQTTINNLMAELNSDYSTHNMIFCADPATFTEDAANYAHDENTEEVSLKSAYNVTPTQVINIYVVGSMGPGGYARYPYDPMGGTSSTGGIVLNRGNCSVGTHTLAHEMGHVFGLAHTFAGVDEQGECSNCYERVRNPNGSSNTSGTPTPLGGPYNDEGDREGDWCSDTHPHDTYAYNCGTSSNANGTCDSDPWNNAPVNNHMSYSFCSSQFTDQQERRMHCMVDSYLGTWTSYGGGLCGTQPPTADFIGTPTTWQAPANVNFTDQSLPQNIITGWTWTFDVGASNTVTCTGCTGTNATFVGQTPPVVNYPNAGLYTVSLTITSANGPDTETKVDYILVNAPAGDCDTLTTQWETPAPTIITYGFGGGWITGVQDPVNSVLPTDPKGVYEGYFSPNPGTTPVGAVRVGLGSLRDDDNDMTFQVVVYDDDGAGAPGAIVGGSGGISPTDLGVPGAGFYNDFWIPLQTPAVPTTGYFHVGVEIFPGDNIDTLVVMTSCLGPTGCAVAQGENDASNHIWTTGFGYENLQTVYGADFDVDIIPMLGEYAPLPLVTGFTENVVCDTTYVTIFDTVYYSTPNSWTITFADGTVINSTTDPVSIDRVYTSPGPDTVTFAVINDCGRADTTTWIIPYGFLETPDAEFAASPGNPVCMNSAVNFTANTAGYPDYNWDFGDGTTLSSGNNEVTSHTYTTPGVYYVELTATQAGYLVADTFYLEDFESGWPAGYDRYDNDPFTPNVGVNPPFTGSNATAWLDLDADGDGDIEATSTSWNGPSETGDDWMLTSGIGALPANQRLFWDAEALSVGFPDGYEVRISTTQLPATTANYSTLLFSVGAENSFNTTRSVDLSGYAGQTVYIAFRNNSTDEYLLTIDNIRIGTATSGCDASLLKTDYVEVIDCSIVQPTTTLNASTTTGCAPLTVTFTDATVAGDPATSWLWNFGDGTFSTAQNPPPHVYTTTGSYYVTFESCNTGGCTQTSTTIDVGTAPVITNVATTDPTCLNNDGSIVITATGGNGALTYSINNGSTFSGSNTFNGQAANTYSIVVEDTYGCQATSSATLTAPTPPSITNVATTPAACGAATGSIDITATGGNGGLMYSINGGANYQAGNTFSSLNSGLYNIVVQDALFCEATTSVTITAPGSPVISSVNTTNPTCGATNGSIVINASGGSGSLTYSIDNGTNFFASGTFTGLGTGTFPIVVEDALGCQVTSSVTLVDPGNPTISNVNVTHTSCGNNDGVLDIIATGGSGTYTYSIDNGVNFFGTSIFSGQAANTYNIVIEDGFGCQASTTATINPSSNPTITAVNTTGTTCGTSDGSLEIIAANGSGTYTYSIDNGVNFSASNTFTGLSAGTYNIVVEDDLGCQVTASAVVDPSNNPTVSIDLVTDVLCNGDSNGGVDITAANGVGPYTYDWSNDGTGDFDDVEDITGIAAGWIYITVMDDLGCTVSDSAQVGSQVAMSATGTSTDETFGNDGSIDMTPTGGVPPYTFDWSNDGTGDNDDTEDLSGLAGNTTYTVIITDANGCTFTLDVYVGSVISLGELDNPMGVSIYPNPSGGQFNVSFQNFEGDVQLDVVDVTGRLVFQSVQNVGEQEKIAVDISKAAAGSYSVNVITEDGTYVIRLIKE